ncbi:uncharacterized protein PHACADRAFT_264884 [Phanerochaete carnosa HHB-10118-sp]|uniref:Malate dehydrogenase n=1 Tax=Phanerochaete carnosa (strain HHB-10118-sp) TaxID=650164 RepID=K5VU12_PHACS|nr:uncharacterized protein PHACADRAFT_264884 [Phanerochaete carnosa HHB-10118-sp]EKM50280.1 hypothetical protein PHACADRAFT_264884 [Phanerochaete carnosa HHB-10118-sp]
MYAFVKLFSALSLLSAAHAFFMPAARADTPPANLSTGGSICSTKQFSIEAALPSDINSNGGEPLPAPVASYPTYTALSVGVQNYTCVNNAWSPIGAITYLFDISCLPQEHHAPFTSFIGALWEAAPPTYTAADIVSLTEEINPGVALGIHYWIPDPVNVTSGKIFAKWDFSQSERMENDTNKANAFLVASEVGSVPDPTNPALNSPWLTEPVLVIDGQPDGDLATQVFRFNSNGGQPPNTTCGSSADFLQVKSTLDFWFFGGYWQNATF